MDLIDLGYSLMGIGTISSTGFGISAMYKNYREKGAFASTILMAIGSSMSVAGFNIATIGVDNNVQEITGYVSSLSDEELENLSEDLVSEDISVTDIEEELADRINLLSENNDMFSLDEYRELLQESVISYLRQLNYFNPEEYDEIIELFSDGYDDGELSQKIGKSLVIKKMDL